jgi:lysozyme family protein
MPKTVGEQLYLAHFWTPGRYAEIAHQSSATKVYDFAVNAGQGTAWRVAQRAAGLAPGACDGVPGAISLAAVNALGPAFVKTMAVSMTVYYEDCIRRRPDNEVFRSNWMKRASWGV